MSLLSIYPHTGACGVAHPRYRVYESRLYCAKRHRQTLAQAMLANKHQIAHIAIERIMAGRRTGATDQLIETKLQEKRAHLPPLLATASHRSAPLSMESDSISPRNLCRWSCLFCLAVCGAAISASVVRISQTMLSVRRLSSSGDYSLICIRSARPLSITSEIENNTTTS